MTSLKTYYLSLDRKSRLGVLIGTAVILLGATLVLWWIFSSKQQLLFGNLREADAAEIAQSLNEWKVPHSFSEDGAGIFVDAKDVHDTRMRLVSAGVPRGGHVGFELFDDNDFGVTEFAQRINYQRALQGEIERTIAALPGVSDVRVHLAIKRPGLFLSRQEESKASVALNIAPGAEIGSKQIGGIKSLVAAAVEGLSPESVVVIGPGGMPLAGGPGNSIQDLTGQQEESSLTAARLEQRVTALLHKALNSDEATVSVDVRLNFDRVQKTSERLLAQPGSSLGLITKRNSSGVRTAEAGAVPGPSDEQIEYAHGTEREEVIQAAGTVERLSVAVLLPQPIAATEVDHLRRLIGAAVGLDAGRGDRLEIAFAPKAPVASLASIDIGRGAPPALPKHANKYFPGEFPWSVWLGLSVAIGVCLGLLVAGLVRKRKRPALTDQESEIVAARIRAWLAGEQAAQ